jgi:hypothetical protein
MKTFSVSLILLFGLGACTPDNGASMTGTGGSGGSGTPSATGGSGGGSAGSGGGSAGSGGSGGAAGRGGSTGGAGSGGGSAGSGGGSGAGGAKAPDAGKPADMGGGGGDSGGGGGGAAADPKNWPGCLPIVFSGQTPADFCSVYAKVCGFMGMNHYTSMMDCMTGFKGGPNDGDACKAGHLCRAATIQQSAQMKESDCQTSAKSRCSN